MKPCQVYPGFGHQGGQPGKEVEWFEEDMRRTIAVRCLQLITYVAIGRE